jgi:L,D-transpeptidase ErfK/SrfK
MRASQGCFQMFPENVAQLFPMVPVGTPVRIIDQPNLVGVRDEQVYLQSYKPMHAYHKKGIPDLQRAVMTIKSFMVQNHINQDIDWAKVRRIVAEHNTVALPIGVDAPSYKTLSAALPATPYAYAPYGPSAHGAAVPPPLSLTSAHNQEHLHVQVTFPDQKP